jgi:hypothetical protein
MIDREKGGMNWSAIGAVAGVLALVWAYYTYWHPLPQGSLSVQQNQNIVEPDCNNLTPVNGGAPGTGLIVVSSDSASAKDATVYLNQIWQGKMINAQGKIFFTIRDVSPGTYTIRVTKPGYRDFNISDCVKAGHRTDVYVNLIR